MIEKQTRDNKIEISKLAKETIKLSANIEDVGEALGEVQTAVTTATSGIAALEAATTALTEQTNTVKANISALTQQTTALETQTSSLQIANVGINERLGVVESDLTTQNSTLETHTTELAALSARITALENIDSGNTGGDSGNTGNTGNTGGDDIEANDNFGTKYYNVTDISELYNDYETESEFAAKSTAKFPVCVINASGPETSVYFRHNIKNKNTTPHIKLWFWISGLPEDLTTIPCSITLNGNAALSTELTLLENTEDGHSFFCEFDIDPALHTPKVFNDCHIKLNSTALAESFWDWIKIEISNAHNPIILNRSNEFEIVMAYNTSDKYINFSQKYNGGGIWKYFGGENQPLDEDSILIRSFLGNTIGDEHFKFACHLIQQNLQKKFFWGSGKYIHLFITQSNKLYVQHPDLSFSSLASSNYYFENVLQAKKSLHNGVDKNLDCLCIVFNDFSLKLINVYYYLSMPSDYFTPVNFTFAGQVYPKEFIDFIPVYDHSNIGLKTQKVSCGYLLHHLSGNILFVPECESTYFIKIGKGRQVHAFLSQDNLKIDVFFQNENNVMKKTLARTDENSEWTLQNDVEYFVNYEEVVARLNDYYLIKNHDILLSDQ